MTKGELKIGVKAFGPSPDELATLGRTILSNAAVQKTLGKARHRLLGVQLVDTPEDTRKRARPARPDLFRATVYDYSGNRALLVDGSLKDPSRLTITESALQPPVSNEEWDEAVALLALT